MNKAEMYTTKALMFVVSMLVNTRAFATQKIIGLAVGLTVASAVLPSAIISISDVDNWTGAPSAVLTLVPVIGIIAVVALILMVLRRR